MFYLLILLVPLGLCALRALLKSHWGRADIPQGLCLRGKLALVTGASSGIGFETAVQLAERGCKVIVSARTFKAAKKLVVQLRNRTFLGDFVPLPLDLASLESIRKFSAVINEQFEKLDLLILNAGVLMPMKKNTIDGHELHFAVNHLGHFYLTGLLSGLLKGSRIVVVSSFNHADRINFKDLNYANHSNQFSPSNNPMYRQSKLANILFAKELRRRGAKVYICCPGIVKTGISRNLELSKVLAFFEPVFSWILKSPEQGAQTVLHCALAEDLKEEFEDGILYRHCRPWKFGKMCFPDDFLGAKAENANYSDEDCERLWVVSEEIVGIRFETFKGD